MSLTQLIIESMIGTVHAISFLVGLFCLCDSKYFYSSVEQDQTMYVLFTRQFLIFFPMREKRSYMHIVCCAISMVLFFALLYNYYSSFTPPTLLCLCDQERHLVVRSFTFLLAGFFHVLKPKHTWMLVLVPFNLTTLVNGQSVK